MNQFKQIRYSFYCSLEKLRLGRIVNMTDGMGWIWGKKPVKGYKLKKGEVKIIYKDVMKFNRGDILKLKNYIFSIYHDKIEKDDFIVILNHKICFYDVYSIKQKLIIYDVYDNNLYEPRIHEIGEKIN